MPRGPRKILFSVFDAPSILTLEAIAEAPISFMGLLRKTALPKATAHRVLVNLTRNKLAKKLDNRYKITSDGEFVLESFRSIRARSMLKITDDGLRRVLNQVDRTLRMENSGFNRFEQFQSIQEAVENVKIVEMPA